MKNYQVQIEEQNRIYLKKAEKVFMNYISSYDMKNPKIHLKVCHTKRVEQAAINVAKSLNLSEEQIKLAALIGLLHDIGRFEQVKKYNTFNDSISVDHADFGIKVLFEDNLIRNFIKETTYDEIIRKAIHNHNKHQIEDGLSEQELLYAKIIRDADKIDILYTIKIEPFTTLYGKEDISDEILTDKVYNSIMNGELPYYKDKKTDVDDWVNKAGYIFDLYFPYSLQTIRSDLFTCLYRVNYQDEQTKERIANIEKMLIDYFEKNAK